VFRSSRPPSRKWPVDPKTPPEAGRNHSVGDPELIRMLAAEADRRCPAIIAGIEALAASGEKDPDRIEQLRVEAHGLKGAALVVGQERLRGLPPPTEGLLPNPLPAGGGAQSRARPQRWSRRRARSTRGPRRLPRASASPSPSASRSPRSTMRGRAEARSRRPRFLVSCLRGRSRAP